MNQNQIDMFFEDFDTAFGFVQGSVRRTLTLANVEINIIDIEDDPEGHVVITYKMNDVLICQYTSINKTFDWFQETEKSVAKLIRAHVSLFD